MPHIDMSGRCFTFSVPYLAIFMPSAKIRKLFCFETYNDFFTII